MKKILVFNIVLILNNVFEYLKLYFYLDFNGTFWNVKSFCNHDLNMIHPLRGRVNLVLEILN